jgi:hypothetical protein
MRDYGARLNPKSGRGDSANCPPAVHRRVTSHAGPIQAGCWAVDQRTERLVVFQVARLRRGRERRRMYRALRGTEQQRVDDAISSLESVGVVIVKGQSVHQSAALRRIDGLDLICV